MLERGGLGAGSRLALLTALVSIVLLPATPTSAADANAGTNDSSQTAKTNAGESDSTQTEDSTSDDNSVDVSSGDSQPGDAEYVGQETLPAWDEQAPPPWEGREQRRGTIPQGYGPSSSSALGGRDAFDARRRARDVRGFSNVAPGLTVDGSLTADLIYDDNPLLQNSQGTGGRDTGVWGYDIQPGLTLTKRSAQTVLQSAVRLSINDLNSIGNGRNTGLGSFDQYGGVQLDRLGQNTRINLFANIANSTTRKEIVADTGQGLSNNRVLTYGGGGSLTYAVSPRSGLQVFSAVRRRAVAVATLSNYTSIQAGVGYGSNLTPTDNAALTVEYERFNFDASASPGADTVTALASWSHRANSAVSFDIEAGPQFVFDGAVSGGSNKGSSVGLFATASVQVAASRRDNFTFSASRSAGASVTGQVRTQNRFEAAYERDMSRDIFFRLPVSLSVQANVFANGTGNRSLLSVAPDLVWAWAPTWGLSAQYRYRRENEGGSSAASNEVILSLRYLGRLIP